ncbi:MAG: flagellar motor protein MotB [Alphaproteobacteria bacterium]|nr:flagellar motor protein MotB [Alphaproteobacteria bacterium]
MSASKDKEEKKRPIIIKKIKKGGHGHHGGAWKVAYADFVTAMMAFFLLLWLLSTSSKETLQGLSEYFTPTQGIKDSQGIGFKGGIAPTTEGAAKGNKSDPAIVNGYTPSGIVADDPDKKSKEESEMDDNLFKSGADAITQAFSQDAALKQYSENITVTQTPEGLRIDITDTDKFAMFERSGAGLTDHGRIILSKMATLIEKMPNLMAIYGHTDASPTEAGKAEYSNWELSADRAQSARRFLTRSGVEAERTKKVTGMADRELFTPSEPRGPKNRRISLVMLRGSHILIPDSAVPPSAVLDNPKPPAGPDAAPVTAPAPAAAH